MRRPQRQLEPEATAEAERAVDADLAAHQLDQLFAYRQSETAAAEAASDRGIGLAEFFK